MVEENASPPKGEPAPVPYRDRMPTLRDGVAPPSQRVVGDGAPARAVGDGPSLKASDVPVAVLRAELQDRDQQMGRMLALLSELQQREAERTHAESLRPPTASAMPKAESEEELPTPAAWKGALFKLVVSLGAVLTAAATWLGVHNTTTIPPKLEAQEVRTTVTEKRTDTTASELAELRGRVGSLEQRNREWIAYWIETQRIQGVEVRSPEWAPKEAPKLEIEVPMRHSGDGPLLKIKTPPP